MPKSQRLRLGFLASHGGSSMRAIVAAIRAGELDADPRLLISNNASSPAMAFAAAEGLAHRHISIATEGGAEAADRAIADALEAAGVDLVILSGYLRPVGPQTLARYRGRILNIHPALLPSHGGKGMYGRRVHEAVAAAGDAETGATVHLVDERYDAGPILAQVRLPVAGGETPEQIEARVMAAEPRLFVDTLKALGEGRLGLPVPGATISDNLP